MIMSDNLFLLNATQNSYCKHRSLNYHDNAWKAGKPSSSKALQVAARKAFFNLPTETMNETGIWDTNKSHSLLINFLIKTFLHNESVLSVNIVYFIIKECFR